MKTKLHSLLVLIFALATANTFGQIVPSSCTAPDSIIAKYKDDADRLALRKIYRNNLSFKDSIHIPKDHSDTVLNALIAVYNATTLPARDTVVAMFDIHSFPDIVMNSIIVAADSNLSWMQQLRSGNIPTGNTTVDSLIAAHYLSISNYYNNFNLYYWHTVVFKSDSNFNLPPLTILFNAIPGVNFSEPNGFIGDGNNIWDSIYTDHIELIYSIGWGDCPAGCTGRRFWKFNVDFNCSVEYVGSYGNPLLITGINDINKKTISIGPNPFSTLTTLQTSKFLKNATLTVYNSFGQLVKQIKNISGQTITLHRDNLPSGLYFLHLTQDNKTITTDKLIITD